MDTYLVERYLPDISEEALLAACSRTMAAAAEMNAAGVPVHYLGSTFAPEEESCFCLFAGPSLAAVQEANERANFAFARIVPVTRIFPTTSGSASTTQGR